MNKYYLLLTLCTLTSAAPSKGMEEDWTNVSSAEDSICWATVRQTISDSINAQENNPSMQKSTKELSIIKTPESLFPGLINRFNGSFFTKLCTQNTVFDKALQEIINKIHKNVTQDLNGSNIDTKTSIDIHDIVDVCKKLRKFIQTKLEKTHGYPLSYTLAGHSKSIRCLSLHHETIQAATSSNDNTTCIWNLYTGQQQCLLQHKTPMNSVSFHSSGSLLATTHQDHIILWDIKTGTALNTLTHDTHPFNCAYFSHNDNILLAYNCNDIDHHTKDCIILWNITPDGNTQYVSIMYLPLYKANPSFDSISNRCGSIEIDGKNLIYKKKSYPYALCLAALHNSRHNKKELTSLLQSNIFQTLPDIDKTPLLSTINQEIEKLSQQKSIAIKHSSSEVELASFEKK